MECDICEKEAPLEDLAQYWDEIEAVSFTAHPKCARERGYVGMPEVTE